MDRTGKVLIWDLGNTLLQADMFCFASEIGIADFILYPLLEWKNPKKIHELALKIIAQIDGHKHDAYPHATAQGSTLPAILCLWLAGGVTQDQIERIATQSLENWFAQGHFKSKRQQRLVTNTLSIMLDPKRFTRCMKPIQPAIEILKECAEKLDEHGNKLNKLYILSNWDPHSFEYLLKSPINSNLFSYFDSQHILISGHIGSIKPQQAIYQHFIEKYSLEPKNCILIDDQVENIIGAEKMGITGILLEDGNYPKLKKELHTLGVL